MTESWIVTTTTRIAPLIDVARELGGPVHVIAVGARAEACGDVDTAVAVDLPDGVPPEALAAGVASLVPQDAPVVLVPDQSTDRVLAGAIGARLRAHVLKAPVEVDPEAVTVNRYGGIVSQTIALDAPTVILVAPGEEAVGLPASIRRTDETAPVPATGDRVLSREPAPVVSTDVQVAKRVVAVGRGFRSKEDLALAQDLADAIGAALVCSRPLAEGLDWMPKQTYVGVSGLHLSPEVYIAVGVSGQLQHMAGCAGARRVVAINTDEKAPVFTQADYGVVGDLYEVLPALTAALEGRS